MDPRPERSPAASGSVRRVLPVLLLTGAAVFVMPSSVLAEDTVRVGGTGSSTRTVQILAEAFHKTSARGRVVIVPGLGGRGSKRALLAGALDIAITAEPLGPSEREQGLVAHEWLRTPFVFATASKSPLADLTLHELVDIYNGTLVTWRDGSRVRLILRPQGDSDTATLKAISPAMAQAVDRAHGRPGLKTAATDQDSAEALETIPGAIGTSTLALIVSEQRALKALSIGGVRPTPKAIADRSYPYFKTFYLVTGRDPSELAQQFLTFVKSTSARESLTRLGYWVP